MSNTKINNTAFAVERYVPRPNSADTVASAGRPTLYPFNLMARGDSFQVPVELSTKLKNAARMYANKNGVTFEIDEQPEYTRIWKLK